MARIKLWAAVTLFLVVRAKGLEVFTKQNQSSYSESMAFTVQVGNSKTGGTQSRSRSKGDPPGEDGDPEGVVIYESLDAVPTARMLARGLTTVKCFPKRGCWRPYICGHRCEQILLAVNGFCRRTSECREAGGCGKWKRCKKARKFNRCFARICYRGKGSGRPGGYEDSRMVAIVRYRKPLPSHEALAKKNRQSSAQSAIFK